MGGVCLNKKWGFVDRTGNEVVPLKYDNAMPFIDGLAAVCINGKWGYTDKTGNEVIPVKYDNVPPTFIDGLAAVYTDNKWGYIDRTGKDVVPPKYDAMMPFYEDLAAVCINKKWGYIDKSGNDVIALQYDIPFLSRFDNGWYVNLLTQTKAGYYYTFVKPEARSMFTIGFRETGIFEAFEGAAHYLRLASFSNGTAAVCRDGKWGFIDREGNETVPLKYDRIEPFSEGLAVVSAGGKWGYVDSTGTEIIPLRFSGALSFSEGLAGVCITTSNAGEEVKLWGFIDKDKNQVVPFKYARVCDFSDGMAAVGLNNRWGYIDREGNEIVPLIYRRPPEVVIGYNFYGKYSNGLAPVLKGFSFGFVDKTGKLIIPFDKYSVVSNFSNGYAMVGHKNGKMGLIDTKGNEVVPAECFMIENAFIAGLALYQISNINIHSDLIYQMPYGNIINPSIPVNIRMKDGWIRAGNGFSFINVNANNYRPLKKGKWGFVDRDGKPLVIH
jgi:hypothetical protein